MASLRLLDTWRLFSAPQSLQKTLLNCTHWKPPSPYNIHSVVPRILLTTAVPLRSSSTIGADILGQLNLRPEAHRQDPRDQVPTSVKTPTPQAVTELPIMHIKATHNNTIVTLSDAGGRVLAWTSAGAVGFKGARRGTNFAGQEAGAEAARKALKLGFKSFQVKLKGTGPGRKPSLKGLEMGGINIITLQDVTPVPHNGCRPRKARRL
ncbi:30S ribosomal protein S11 [Geodia barretti]|uniref:30S ribosomal protein S11 n=1 Tax=Geodia barretti TaxID=519541 RepID=A0AA35WGJ2_GEOBA|nr:30S ribosomal protein S11 [Geodia barretti]